MLKRATNRRRVSKRTRSRLSFGLETGCQPFGITNKQSLADSSPVINKSIDKVETFVVHGVVTIRTLRSTGTLLPQPERVKTRASVAPTAQDAQNLRQTTEHTRKAATLSACVRRHCTGQPRRITLSGSYDGSTERKARSWRDVGYNIRQSKP